MVIVTVLRGATAASGHRVVMFSGVDPVLELFDFRDERSDRAVHETAMPGLPTASPARASRLWGWRRRWGERDPAALMEYVDGTSVSPAGWPTAMARVRQEINRIDARGLKWADARYNAGHTPRPPARAADPKLWPRALAVASVGSPSMAPMPGSIR